MKTILQTANIPNTFRGIAVRFGSNVAVTSLDGALTYADLNQLSDHLAARLIARGIKSGDLVGVSTARTQHTIIALLGILKAGAGYVPLPEHYPAERLQQILADSAIAVTLADHLAVSVPGMETLPVATVLAEAPGPTLARADPMADNIAYVMFTSGSTGQPKGVMVPHRAVLRLVRGQNFMTLGPDERILQNAPMAFDASTLEIWGALLNGGTLVLAPQERLSLRALGDTIRDQRITSMWLTAGVFHAMADERPGDFRSVRQLITGGDVVSPAQVAKVLAVCPDLTVINGYGPTENTTFTCCHRISHSDLTSGKPLPIGKAINGTQIYVTDADLIPLAAGREGELCVAGAGLALGYQGRPDLTAEKFVQAPWQDGLLLYRTGDLVRQDADGTVRFLGRIDTQVKLRGYRVELGEVEAAMEACAGIRAAVAVAKPGPDGADKILVGYYLPADDFNAETLNQTLAARLPEHAIPSWLVPLDTLPLNENGKVDRRALATRDLLRAAVAEAATPHKSAFAIEDRLAADVADVLGLDDPDRRANFFDLGASSLHLARIHERLQRALGRNLPITDFFLHSTIQSMARHLAAKSDLQGRPVPDRASPASTTDAPIAIVGMAGRFPGARDVESLWEGLLSGREMISHFTRAELEYDPSQAEPTAPFVLARGVMDAPAEFDAKHFGITPREAERMDPQHRVLLEVAQTALENAGHDPERFAGRIGIFAGSSQNSYLLNNLMSAPGAARAFAAGYPVRDFSTLFGNDKDFIATRIAYKLNLRGPAVTVQCACSTSLVAVAQACDSLRRGLADMALAGGVSVTFPTRRPYLYTPDGMASADGHCRTFDAAATGTVFGDGAGLVVLRRLDDALADGDQIIAVIRGYAINNDGSDKAGYAAPSIRAQSEVIRAAHLAAGVEPRSIGYVEAHGTGTPLGDPIEFAALHAAFGATETGYCAIGTAKTNVGHLDIAAGITGLIKAALTVQHGEIPPLLHYERQNPNIDFAASAFFPVTERMPWPAGHALRRAGVSAFGVGGTNIHMVLDQPPATEPALPVTSGPAVFGLSASSPEALKAAALDLADWAEKHPDADPRAVAETLRTGRREFGHRTVIVAEGMAGLASTARKPVRPVSMARTDQTAFLFPGQGAQHFGMGRALFARAPVFRKALTLCAELLAPDLGVNLLDVIHAPEAERDAMTARLKDTAIAQPAIFAMGYALVKQWAHWGVTPDAMIGHSIGEFAAATIAGVIALPDALRLIALRGRLMSDLAPGVMLSVQATEAEVEPFLGAEMDLAAVNGARACVISGPETAAAAVILALEAAGHLTARLHTSHAFHSRMMDPAVGPFRAAVAAIKLNPPTIPILSTVTGNWLTAGEAADPDYWAGQMRKPVRFFAAIQLLWSEGRHLMIETGPGRTLATLALQNPDRARMLPAIASLPHAQAADADAHHAMLEAFGMVWAHGREVDWSRLDAPDAAPIRRATGLPTYPFQRKLHWVEPANVDAAAPAPALDASPEPASGPDADGETVADGLRAMFAELSGLEASDLAGDVSFLGLGFDSLLLTQATRELSDRFGVLISLRALIDGFPTINVLAAHIEASGPQRLRGAAKASQPTRTENDGNFVVSTVPEATPVSAPVTRLEREKLKLTAGQQAHIDALTKRFNAKTPKSKALTAQYRRTHADPRTASGFNRMWKEIVYQIVTVRSKGSRLLDVDGNEYIDLLNGFGPGFLGHSPKVVVEALQHQLAAGFEVGPQSLLAMEAAELFCQVTGNDRASFVCTGSEAVYAAIRLARTVTARDRVVLFARDYHGNFDEVLVRGVDGRDGPRTLPLAPGIPRDAVRNVVVLPYGTPQALDYIRTHADSLAAVIIEPVQSRRPEFRPADFVTEVRRLTEQSGALLIFDEVVTGFRFGRRGAQALYGVSADLVTYGKVVGGGMPVGVVAGKARYMDTFDGGQWSYGDDSFPQAPVTFFAGTFVRHPLAMAAVKAMLLFLRDQPEFFWHAINTKGDRLAGGIDRWFAENDMPFAMPNFGSLMYLRVAEDQPFGALLGAHMRDRGVFLLEGFPSYMTAAHDDEDIDHALAAFKDAALELRANGMLQGREAVEYVGPQVHAAPPRLALPGGEALIAAAMAAPLGSIMVPATEAQREIWAAMVVTPDVAPAYNESITLTLTGPVDRAVMLAAVREGLLRHDAFRTTFSADGDLMQVQATSDLAVTLLDLTQRSRKDRDRAMAELLVAEVRIPFDMAAGPYVRAHMVVMEANEHRLVITAHHIVCDGWSIDVVVRDISEIYSARLGGHAPQLPAAQSIIDYARAEVEWSRSPAAQADEDYWLGQFRDLPPALELPTDHPRGTNRAVRGARIDRALPAPLVERLRQLARTQNATFVNVLLAAWKLYIAELSDVSDITIGLPASGQAARNMPNVVGHCVSLLPIRTRIDWSAGFDTYLSVVRKALLDAYDHQTYTYGSLIRALKLPRDLSRVMLVPVVFNIDNGIDLSSMAFGDTHSTLVTNPRSYEHFEIYLNVTNAADQVLTEWSYKADLFEPATIERHIDRFLTLLATLADAPSLPLARLYRGAPVPFHGAAPTAELAISQRQTAEASLGTVPGEAENDSLIPAFARVVAQWPDATALYGVDGRSLTYGQLDRCSNALAASLIALSVKPGDLVGIEARRGIETIVALLGILKCGAGYVPLPHYFPQERLRLIAMQADLGVVIGDVPALAGLGLHTLASADLACAPTQPGIFFTPPPGIGGENLAYVMYTSGSTGAPKGVAVPHRGILRLVVGQDFAALGPDERILLNSPIAFDAATFEIWGALLNGGTLVIASDQALSLGELGATLRQERISTLWLTAGLFHAMADERPEDLAGLRQLLTGGDVVLPARVAKVMAVCPGLIVINGYGPTENTTFTCCHTVTSADLKSGAPLPIGKAIRGTAVHVLDDNLVRTAPGVIGELCISGAGLALGYLGRDDLTAEKFIEAPWQPGLRLYRTGDLVREDTERVVHFLGRVDNQIKIRGFRIEPAEIETVLEAHPNVLRAVVVAVTVRGRTDKSLVAYLRFRGNPTSRQAIFDHVKRHLPDYACPAHIVPIDTVPLNPNGKVDYRSLPPFDPEALSIDPSEPQTETERQLALLWLESLELHRIGMETDFFELGGHSLLAVKLFSKIHRNFGIELPISSLFAHPTIRRLAEMIDAATIQKGQSMHSGAPEDSPWDTCVVVNAGPGGANPASNENDAATDQRGRPLFIVGGVGGNVNNLYELGQFVGTSRPLIGLQTRGVLGHRMHSTIEAMAAEHIVHIRRHQPQGPYLISGYSGGALTAFEIARQLKSSGESVAFLGILDAYAPGFELKNAARGGKGKDRLLMLAKDPVLLLQRGIPWLRDRLLTDRIVGLFTTIAPERMRLLRLARSWMTAAAKYHPVSYDGSLWLFQTRPETPAGRMVLQNFPDYDWGRLVRGKIHRLEHKSDHFSMLTGRDVAELADWLESSILQSGAEQS